MSKLTGVPASQAGVHAPQPPRAIPPALRRLGWRRSRLRVGLVTAITLVFAGCASASGTRPETTGWRNPDTGIVRFLDIYMFPPFSTTALEAVVLTDEGGTLPAIWITEDRVMRYGPYFIPVGRYAADIGFPTQEACERFRAEHPDYTKPHEVCQLRHYRPAPPPPPVR